MHQAECKGGAQEMKALHKKLMDGYDPVIYPKVNYSSPIIVSMQLHVSIVMGLNKVKQLIFMRAFLKTKWTDEFLTWAPEDFAGIDHVLLPQNWIWKPDIILHTSASDLDTIGNEKMLVYVNNKGRVFWEPPFYLEGSCKLDMSHFPYDVNNCPVPIQSWMSDNNTVTFVHPKEPVVLTQMTISGVYEISSPGAYKYNTLYDKGYYESLVFIITLKRRPLYNILRVMLPINILAFLSVVPFLMPPEESGKIDLAMTVMLSFTVFLEVIDDQIPPASDNISILVIYISALMMLSLLSVVGNVAVVTLRNWDEAAGKDTVKANHLDDNVNNDTNVENVTYSSRAHRELLEADVLGTSTLDLTKPLIIMPEKCRRFFKGTRANKLNNACLILACVLLFMISVAVKILFAVTM